MKLNFILAGILLTFTAVAPAQWRTTTIQLTGTPVEPHLVGMTDFTALGDADGDGVCDFALGNDGSGDPSHPNGYVVVFSGADQQIIHLLSDPLTNFGSLYGQGVAAVGDRDGDGHADVAVSEPGDNGVVHIYSGATGAEIELWGSTYYAFHGYGAFGAYLVEVGDPSWVGYRGFATAAPFVDIYNVNYWNDPFNEPEYFMSAGEIRMVGDYGSFFFTGDATNQQIGFGLSLPGDVNGNGSQDGCYYIDGGLMWNGTMVNVVIRDGQNNQILHAWDWNTWAFPGTAVGLPFVAALGDINGDGKGDFVLGPDGRAISGADGSTLYTFPPDRPVSCSDLDGDGTRDFMAGSSVYSGATGATLWNRPHQAFTRFLWDTNFGGIGDFDGDGVNDVYVAYQDTTVPWPNPLPLVIEISSMWGAKRFGEDLGGMQTLDLNWLAGGQSDPAVGTVEITGAAPGALGLMGVSLAPANFDFLGLDVLVDNNPGNVVANLGFGFDLTGELSAPAFIRSPWVGGVSFYFQAFQTWPTLASSNGLELRFVP